MYVRLGFAVAVNVEPDILLVDEVLAVGDEAFQRKCLDRVASFQREGRTIVFVTHAADLVRQICDRAAVLDHGHLVAVGDPREAIQVFREHLRRTPPARGPGEPPPVDDRVRVTSVRFEPPRPSRAVLPRAGPGPVGEGRVRGRRPRRRPGVHADDLRRRGWPRARLEHRVGVRRHRPFDGPGEITFDFAQVPLLDGEYAITLCVTSSDGEFIYDWHEQRYRFEVRDSQRSFGSVEFPVRITVQKGSGQQDPTQGESGDTRSVRHPAAG